MAPVSGGPAACDTALRAHWGESAREGFAWAERGAQLYCQRPGEQGKMARAALVDRGLGQSPAVNVFLCFEALADEIRRVTFHPRTADDRAYARAYRDRSDPNHQAALDYVRGYSRCATA